MKTMLLTLALLTAAPLAHAQVIIQAPAIPGVTVPDHENYWRERREGDREDAWRRREEYREEEHRREGWQRSHCVRDWQNQEYCRR